MSKKDITIIVLILSVMLILLFFGYQDYKRQKAMLENPAGMIEKKATEQIVAFNV